MSGSLSTLMPEDREKSFPGQSVYVGAVLAFAIATYIWFSFYAFGGVVPSGPAPIESFVGLVHGATGSLLNPFDIPAAEGPRFVTYYSFVLQHKLFGGNAYSYYILNVLLVALAAVSVLVIVYVVGRNIIVAFAAGLIFLLNENLYNTADWLLGRQDPLVIIFGAAALLYLNHRGPSFRWFDGFALGPLLLLSACSKEYGLAFYGAAVIFALRYGWPTALKVLGAASVSFLVFVLARHMVADPMFSVQGRLQCDMMGYLFGYRYFCTTTNLTDADNLKQILYNLFAGIAGAVRPDLLANAFVNPIHMSNGAIDIAQMRFADWVFTAIFVSLVVYAVAARTPGAPVFLTLIICSAVLTIPFYRGRAVMVGSIGSIALFSFGVWALCSHASTLVGRFAPFRAFAGSSAPVIAGFALLLLYSTNEYIRPYATRMKNMSDDSVAKLKSDYYCREARKTFEWLDTRLPRLSDEELDRVIRRILTENGLDPKLCPSWS